MGTTESAGINASQMIAQAMGKPVPATAGPPSSDGKGARPSAPQSPQGQPASTFSDKGTLQGIMQSVIKPLMQGGSPIDAMGNLLKAGGENTLKQGNEAQKSLFDAALGAIETQNPLALSQIKKPFTDAFGVDKYNAAEIATQNAMAGKAVGAEKKKQLLQMADPAPSQNPFRFENPWSDFWLPIALGIHPGNVIISNRDRQRHALASHKQGIQDRKWFRDFQTKRDNGVPFTQAFNETATGLGFVPDGAVSLKGMPDTERRERFMKGFNKGMVDPALIDIFAHVKNGQERAKFTSMASLVMSVKKNGYCPPEFVSLYNRAVGLSKMEDDAAVTLEGQKATARKFAEEYATQNIFDDPKGPLYREKEQAYARAMGSGLGQETAAQIAAGMKGSTPIQRKIAELQATQKATKPKIPAAIAKEIGGAKVYSQIMSDINKTIEFFVTKGGTLDKRDNKLIPTGFGEWYRKIFDAYGDTDVLSWLGEFVEPNKERISLRNNTLRMVEVMYSIRGMQLSDTEVKLAQDLQSSMSEGPTSYLIKLRNFQRYLDGMLSGKIEMLEAAGFEVEEAKKLIEAGKIWQAKPTEIYKIDKEYEGTVDGKTVHMVFKGRDSEGNIKWE